MFPSLKCINCSNLQTPPGTLWGKESQKAEDLTLFTPQASPVQLLYLPPCQRPAFPRALEHPSGILCLKSTDQVLLLPQSLKVLSHSSPQTRPPTGNTHLGPTENDPALGGSHMPPITCPSLQEPGQKHPGQGSCGAHPLQVPCSGPK